MRKNPMLVGKAALLMSLGLLTILAGSPTADAQMLLNGAGATFPYPIYSKWFDEYTKVEPTVRFNYQSIGSGGGIKQLSEQTVDFGASDAPLTDEQLKAAKGGEILHFPTVLGAVVLTYSLPEIEKGLKLTPEVIADIFLGKITKWNDPQLTSLNPGMKLPDQAITVMHRSDGSGTTAIFTDYLSKVSQEWSQKVGHGTSVNWPTGLGGKGNEGVAGLVKQSPGAIGYVELIYTLQNNLPYAVVKNAAGNFIEPTIESVSTAAAGAAKEMPEDFRVSITNSPGPQAYPISGFTWLLVYEKQPDKDKGQRLVNFLWWMMHEGQKDAPALHYATLPKEVVTMEEDALKQVTHEGQPLLAKK